MALIVSLGVFIVVVVLSSVFGISTGVPWITGGILAAIGGGIVNAFRH